MSLAIRGVATDTTLKRRLTLLDAVMLNMGSIIGSGIFFVPAGIAATVQDPGVYLGVWVLGGVFSLLGALSLAELGAAIPQAGGHYVYIRRAYGSLLGFLAGWTSFAVIMTASIAAVAVACAQCLGNFVSLNADQIRWVALAVIWFLTGIHLHGVRTGVRIQNVLTFLKIGALIAIIGVGASFVQTHGVRWTHLSADGYPVFGQNPAWSAVGLAMIGVLWAYDGWIQVTYAAGEVADPQKNLPKALWISTLGVIVLYTLINLAYVSVLSMPEMATHPAVASEVLRVAMGSEGKTLVSLAILLSTFGANSGFIFSGARIYYAMAKDAVFFPQVAQVTEGGVPMVSLALQAVWASLLVFTGSFEQLFTYVIFAAWLFYLLAAGAVFILRRREPDLIRPYRTWGYPWTPLLFMLCSGALVLNTLISAPRDSLMGLGIILLGLPAYWYCQNRFGEV